MNKFDHDSKAALRVRCSSCGRTVAHHPFCAKCGKPKLCAGPPDEDTCGCAPRAHAGPSELT